MGEHCGGGRTDALDYLQAMLGQLRTMALAERCEMLAYMIEMAYLEAGDIIRGDQPYHVERSGLELDVRRQKRGRAS